MDEYSPDATCGTKIRTHEPLDSLGTASLTIARLRRFMTDPLTLAEDADAQRATEDITARICRRP